MPRPGRSRPRPTRSPATYTFRGFLIEAYNHVDDLPVLSDAPKKRPRHATRGATAAERRADLATAAAAAAATIDPPSSPAAPTPPPPPVHNPVVPAVPKPVPRRGSRSNLRSVGAPEPVRMKPACSRNPVPGKIRCSICLRKGTSWMILRCIQCAHSVHSYCLNPPHVEHPRGGVWTCRQCVAAPAAEKTQVVRAFRHAVNKYPFLVDRRYIDSMTESVGLAAAAATSTRPSREPEAELDFAVPLPTEQKTRPTENTVILKLTVTDSDVEDVRPGKPLPERKAAARRAIAERVAANSEHNVRKRGVEYGAAPHQARDDGIVRSAFRVKKKMRFPAVHGAADGARASTSPDVAVTALAPGSVPNSSVSPSPSPADGNKPPASRSILRNSRRAKIPRSLKDKRGEAKSPVLLRLRRKPPVFKGKDQGPNSSLQDKEPTAAIEMRKRLAKARAKKAELRRAKKESLAEAAAAAAAAAVAPAAGSFRAPPRTGSVARAAPSIAASSRGTAIVDLTTPALVAMPGSSLGFTKANKSTLGSMGRDLQVDGYTARESGRLGGGKEERRLDPKGLMSVTPSNMVKAYGGSALHRKEGREVGIMESSSGKPRDGFAPRVVTPRIEATEVIVIDDDDDEIPARKDEGQARHAEAALLSMGPRNGQDASRAERLTRAPDARQIQRDKGKLSNLVERKGNAVKDVGGAKCTPEQRTVAKMATLFQSSGRAGETNMRPVPNKWSDISLDAKNEALLTLALGQKGASGKRRPSPVVSSAVAEKEAAIRNPNLLPRTGNVPESERKRMQVTALAVSGRARGTSITTVSESPGTPSRKSSISRLLIDPATVESPEKNDPNLERVTAGKVHSASIDNSNAVRGSNPGGHMQHASTEVPMGRNIERTGRGDLNLTLLTHIPDSSKVPAVDIPVGDASRGASRAAGCGQALLQRSQWDTASTPPAELPRAPIKHSVPIPSSHSGSQSEPGSSVAKGPMMLTLKRPRKKTTMATACNSQIGYRANVDFGRNGDPPLPTTGGIKPFVDEYSSKGNVTVKSGKNQTDADRDGSLMGRAQTSYLQDHKATTLPSDIAASRQAHTMRDVGSGVQCMEPPTDPHVFKKSFRNEHLTHGNYDPLDRVESDIPTPASGQRFDTPASQYQNISNPRSAQGGGVQSNRDSQFGQGQGVALASTSRSAPRVMPFGDAAVPADFQAVPEFEDPIHSDRRLRRSVAPTLPTAARRAQYEQGRAMAMCTPASNASEHQHSYATVRRMRGTQQRFPDPALQRPGPDWAIPSDSHPNSASRPMTPYPSFAQKRAGNNPVLNHQVISQEGTRPHLVPVIYEPDVARNQQQSDMAYGADRIPRLHDASRPLAVDRPTSASRPASASRPVPRAHRPLGGTDYLNDSLSDRGDMGCPVPGDRYKQIPPPRFSTNQDEMYRRYNATLESPQRFNSSRRIRVWGSEIGEAVRARRNSFNGNMNNHETTAGSALLQAGPTTRVNSNSELRAASDPEQQPQPARTDPSLKNLLS